MRRSSVVVVMTFVASGCARADEPRAPEQTQSSAGALSTASVASAREDSGAQTPGPPSGDPVLRTLPMPNKYPDVTRRDASAK